MIFGIIAAGLGLLFGAGSAEIRSFEAHAASEIRHQLQGAHAEVLVTSRSVGLSALVGHFKEVKIAAQNFSTPGLPLFTDPSLSRYGKVDELKIVLRNFDLGNLHICALDSTIPECRFDFGLAIGKKKIRLSKSGEGTGSVTILQSDLEKFILKKYHEIKSVHVICEGGHIHVWGYGQFLIVHTKFDVVAKLAAPAGEALYLTDTAITFDGLPADEYSKRALLNTLNPVVDLNKDLQLQNAITVQVIDVSGGQLTARGTTRIPDRPAPHT